MNVKRFLPILLSVSTSAIVLSGCSDFDNGFDAKEVAYQETFQQAFKNVDPNHNWSTATQGTAKIDVPAGIYTVKIYTANPRYSENRAYMLAQYDNVEGGGTKEFKFDMPANLDYAYVGLIDENGDRMILPCKLNNNAISANFNTAPSTRGIFESNENGIKVEKGDYWTYDASVISAVLNTLPEGTNNQGKVTQNFEYVSMGKFTIYPIYYVTSNTDIRLGIYYFENGNMVVKNIWQRKDYIDYIDGQPDISNVSIQKHEADNDGIYSWVASGGNTDGMYDNNTGTYKTKIDALRAQGITIDIPVGTRFGFYITVKQSELDNASMPYVWNRYDESGRYYSNSEYNIHTGAYAGINHENEHHAYGATFHDNGNLYLAFEDWCMINGSDKDYNDLVIAFHGSAVDPIIIDKDEDVTTMSYMVACEDLGGTLDFDFNDVVFAIQHASGQDNAKIQLRAAGGTLPVKIKYNSDYITFGTKTELHDVFGVDVETPVNVGGYGADFILSENFEVSANTFTVVEDAKDFKIEVTYGEGDVKSTIGVPDKEGGKEPQAFLVADPNWIWPSEGQDIRSKYSDFATWVSDHLQDNWYESVWGNVNEQKSVPDGATDLTSGSVGDITVNYAQDNKSATVTIPNSAFGEEEAYKLVLKSAKDVNVSFTLGDEDMNIMPSGTTYAGKVTTFTFNQTAIDAIKNNGGNVVLTLTYANSGTTDDIQLLYWSGNIGESGSGGSGSQPTTTGITIGSTLSSQDGMWGYHYEINVADGTFDTTKGGTITVTYTSQPSQNSYITTISGTLVSSNNVSVTSCTFSVTLTADQISSIKDGFLVGNYDSSQSTIKRIVYEPASE